MEQEPPLIILVAIPGCIFNLRDFSNAREISNGEQSGLKIEFNKGTYLVLPNYTLNDLDEAFKTGIRRA